MLLVMARIDLECTGMPPTLCPCNSLFMVASCAEPYIVFLMTGSDPFGSEMARWAGERL